MNEPNEQLEHLKQIRDMMERSSRFISLSGLAGVFAGFFALAGATAFYVFINKNLNYGYTDFAKEVPVDISLTFKRFCILDASAVIILSLTFAIFFTTRMAKQKGQKIWDASARRLLFNISVPLASGGIYCLILLKYGWFGLVAPTTLIFYGIALFNGSKYTVDEIRWLGISEIILGITGCFYIGFGITVWVLGFGMLHIIYGLIMYVRYETKPVEKKYW